MAPNRVYYTDLPSSADTVFQVLSAAAQELRRRLPESARVAALADRVASLPSPTRETSRMAWLAGIGERYAQVYRAVQESLSSASERVREGIMGTHQDSPQTRGLGQASGRLRPRCGVLGVSGVRVLPGNGPRGRAGSASSALCAAASHHGHDADALQRADRGDREVATPAISSRP